MIHKNYILSLTLFALFFAACEQKKNEAERENTKTNSNIALDTALIQNLAKENNISVDSAQQIITKAVETKKVLEPIAKNKETIKAEKNTKAESVKEPVNIDEINKLGAAMCNCMLPLEKELKPADIALMETMGAKMDKNLISDTAAMRKFQQENKKEFMQFAFIGMRMQKYFKEGSETKTCLNKLEAEFGLKETQPTSEKAALLADVLEKNGCKFLAIMNRLASGKMQ